MPTEQEKLIGPHHNAANLFSSWLLHVDKPVTLDKRHRELTHNISSPIDLIDIISDWIIQHHISEKKINRLARKRQILDKHGYKEYLKNQRLLPESDRTKKGNITEIIMAEYLKFSSDLDLLVFRLRYNPNVDQSMKGDDVLLFNKQNLGHKIIVGESKFRSTPDKAVVEEIVSAFKTDKNIPISIPFITKVLEDLGEDVMAESLEDLLIELHKQNTPVICVGMLLSTENTSNMVERHLSTENKNFVMISLGITDPGQLVESSFQRANQKLEDL